MSTTRLCVHAALAAMIVVGSATVDASACYKPKRQNPPIPMIPPDPPPRIWQQFDENGVTVWIELRTVFPTTEPHSCAGAVGLGTPTRPLPTGVTFNTAGSPLTIGVLDPTTMMLSPTFPEFNTLQYDTLCTAAWAAGPTFSDPYTGSPETLNWFGFCGVVPPVSPPPLPPGDVSVLCFRLDFNIGDFPLPVYIDAQIGGGLGTASGTPFFQPQASENDHYATYGNVVRICIPTPATGTAGLLLTAGLLRRRRRSD